VVAMAGAAEAHKDGLGVAAFLAEFREFLVNVWVKYAWARILAEAERRRMEVLGEYRYAPMDPGRFPGSASGYYLYESPRGYWFVLDVTRHSSRLVVIGGSEEWDLSVGRGLAYALVWLYWHGFGAEPLESLSRVASSKGAPEVARALETTAGLYRASEPYIAAGLGSGHGGPPEWLREQLVSELLPEAEVAAYRLARAPREEWKKLPWKRIPLSGELHIQITEVLMAFESWRGYRELYESIVDTAVEDYLRLRAAKAVLRVALALGLLE